MPNPDDAGNSTTDSQNHTLIKTAEPSRAAPTPLVLQLGTTGQANAGTFSFGVLWHAFLKRVKLATPLGVVLAAIACAALWYFIEPNYRSHATMRIVDKQPELVFKATEQSNSFAQTQVELLRGPFIISRAIESEGLSQLPELREIAGKEDAVQWIGKRLKALRIGQSEIYEVSFSTKYPESARRVVEAIVDTYMLFQTSETDAQRQRMLEILNDEVIRIKAELANKRKNVGDITQSAVGDDTVVMMTAPDGKGAAASVGRFTLLNSLEQNLATAEVEVEVADARAKALGAVEGDADVPEGYVDAALAKDPQTEKFVHELEQQRKQLSFIKEGSARHQKALAELEKLESELKARKEEVRSRIAAEAKEHFASQRRDALNQAQADHKGKQQAVAALKARVVAEREKLGTHGDKSLEIEAARFDLRNVENVYQKMTERIMHLRTEGRAPAQVLNYQKPKTPEFPEGPTLAKKLVMMGTAAFFAPFALLIGWDLLQRRVFERQQLERAFDLKLVSEVAALPVRPLVPRPGGRRAYELQSHLFEESVNALRTSLAVDDRHKDSCTFVIASAVSGEGKTNLAAQLAMSWSHAAAGKVLVIDADLRAPNLHDLFEVRQGPGLAEVLRGECPVEDAIVMNWGDRLYVLPAGEAGVGSLSALFSGSRFRNLLALLRTQFDKIIIDVPPVLCASETLLIAREADGALLCARHDFSHSGQIKQAHNKLMAAGVHVAGAVLNGAPVHRYTYAYRGYAPV